jgi:hypothetical protein
VRRTEDGKMSQQIWQKEQGRQFCAGYLQFLVYAENRKDIQDTLSFLLSQICLQEAACFKTDTIQNTKSMGPRHEIFGCGFL